MIFQFFSALVTIFVFIALIALIDIRLKSFWGSQGSTPKALLLFFSILSTLYQLAFVFHFSFLFSLIDMTAVALCLLFHKPIWIQLKEYADHTLIQVWKEGERSLFLLYLFLAYLFFLSLFAVPGLNWDSMVYHLVRPFLYWNEGTVFTPHYSDMRQAVWPMGIDVLTYVFTRHGGSTTGVGFIQYIFYVGTLLTVYQTARHQTDRRTAVTLTFVAASFPVLVYGATSVKTDLPVTFAFLLMWNGYYHFNQTRNRSNLFLIFLALAFGLGSKTSFLFLGPLSLAAFAGIEIFNRSLLKPLAGGRWSWPSLALWIPWFLFLAQAHLLLYNFLTYGHLTDDGDYSRIAFELRTWESLKWKNFLQDIVKYHLTFFDFLLPLSTVHIPFIDTLISFGYNHSIGKWLGDTTWDYRYFPHEVRAVFGPLGVLVLWWSYRACFSRTKPLAFALAWLSIAWLFFVAYKIPWGFRYLEPTFIASLVFLPAIFQSKVMQWHRWVRLYSAAVLAFCCLSNFESPLIAYHPRAVPWYTYAFSDRGFFYRRKYYLDDRMDLYRRLIKTGDRVFVFAGVSDWVFPFYQYSSGAGVRLGNFDHGEESWAKINFHDYDLVVCHWQNCIQAWDAKKDFEKVWEDSGPKYEPGPRFFEKHMTFYRPK